MRYAWAAVVFAGIQPSRVATRWTWVSIGNAARPMENTSTQAAVFGPTPGSEVRYSSTDASSRSWSRLRSIRPSRARIAARICWIRRAFWSAMPPERMASATAPAGAARTSSQSGNAALSWAKARSELMSEVCWDSTVATTSSMTGSRGLATNGLWLARSRRCTEAIRAGSGVISGHLAGRQGGDLLGGVAEPSEHGPGVLPGGRDGIHARPAAWQRDGRQDGVQVPGRRTDRGPARPGRELGVVPDVGGLAPPAVCDARGVE